MRVISSMRSSTRSRRRPEHNARESAEVHVKTMDEVAYLKRKAEIRSDPSLSWEKKERKIKALTDE